MNNLLNASTQSEDFEFQALGEAQNYRAALISEFSDFLHGNVIEIGAGIGHMTGELLRLSKIDHLLSVEPEASFCKKHRELYPKAELIEGRITDVKENVHWDAILSVNVLEHIEADEQELSRYSKLLRQHGGTRCLFVPARPEIYAPIDRDFGHFRRYVKDELVCKLKNSGFSVISIDYFNMLGYFAWWVIFCVLKKRSFGIAKVRLYDRMMFPLVHLAERMICRPPTGQSLIVVARSGSL
jgi:SAM-dependent methyltransferase